MRAKEPRKANDVLINLAFIFMGVAMVWEEGRTGLMAAALLCIVCAWKIIFRSRRNTDQ